MQLQLIKECARCGRQRPISDFLAGRKGGDGHRAECRDCTNELRRERYAASPEQRQLIQRRNRGWAVRNPSRARRIRRRWYEANRKRLLAEWAVAYRADPTLMKERVRAWQQANPARRNEYDRRRKAAKHSRSVGNITEELLAQKFAYWGNRCWMCGAPNPKEADHVKPLTRGGLHALANIRPACKPCNSAKCNRWPFPLKGVPNWQSQRERHIWTLPLD